MKNVDMKLEAHGNNLTVKVSSRKNALESPHEGLEHATLKLEV